MGAGSHINKLVFITQLNWWYDKETEKGRVLSIENNDGFLEEVISKDLKDDWVLVIGKGKRNRRNSKATKSAIRLGMKAVQCG